MKSLLVSVVIMILGSAQAIQRFSYGSCPGHRMDHRRRRTVSSFSREADEPFIQSPLYVSVMKKADEKFDRFLWSITKYRLKCKNPCRSRTQNSRENSLRSRFHVSRERACQPFHGSFCTMSTVTWRLVLELAFFVVYLSVQTVVRLMFSVDHFSK